MSIKLQHINALEVWFALRNDPKFLLATPEERYETRLALADDLKQQRLINESEWVSSQRKRLRHAGELD
ncbi:hypothetical protein [Pseudomonas sp. R2-60-08W]|uniref:hypothetical protein n=1 Tax=Pseudomonas sp. R2-60-08W TaxID=1173280 RepID=UPI000F5808D2|nr:hypothetical protein [Pseudomonas sp. R2-60-08W]AZF27475.1 hypothetical protein C4J90_3309 [Pseudomonas sp. R2-60-08W]